MKKVSRLLNYEVSIVNINLLSVQWNVSHIPERGMWVNKVSVQYSDGGGGE